MSMLLPLAFAGLVAAGTAVAADDPLGSYRWRNRVLVVSAPQLTEGRLAEQRRLYDATRKGMNERDLVLVEAIGMGRDAMSIRRRLGITDNAFAVILVGKDGGAKLRSDRPIPSEQLFDIVDEMPMRRDEIRRRPQG